MIRLTKLADYGIVLLIHFARSEAGVLLTARGLAESTTLPLPTVTRVLKTLVKEGWLQSHRGVNGGYTLKESAKTNSVATIVERLDGPIGLTECVVAEESECSQQGDCPARPHWAVISEAVHHALDSLTLADMAGATTEDVRERVQVRLSVAGSD